LPFLSQKREIFSPKKFAKKIKNHNNGSWLGQLIGPSEAYLIWTFDNENIPLGNPDYSDAS
jgi:hypothetical protein